MADTLRPAMPAPDWESLKRLGRTRHPDDFDELVDLAHGMIAARDWHAVAAAMLAGQPFGFDWRDVEDEYACAREFRLAANSLPSGAERSLAIARAVGHLERAEKIASLLPPPARDHVEDLIATARAAYQAFGATADYTRERVATLIWPPAQYD